MGVASVTDRVWNALTAMIKLEDKVTRQSEALKAQQAKIENLTERVIRLEAQLELLTTAALVKRIKSGA
jgi:cell division protein FtsB